MGFPYSGKLPSPVSSCSYKISCAPGRGIVILPVVMTDRRRLYIQNYLNP